MSIDLAMDVKKFALIILLPLLLFSARAFANDDDATTDKGNELVKYCSNKNHSDHAAMWSICVIWVSGIESGLEYGVLDDYTLNSARKKHLPSSEELFTRYHLVERYCIPENVTREQMALVVTKYLEEHPETLNQEDVFEIQAAFKHAWPCPPIALDLDKPR